MSAAGELLLGLWRPSAGATQCTDERIGKLQAVYRSLPTDAATAYLYLRLLVAAAECGRPHDEATVTALRAAGRLAAVPLPPADAAPLLARIDRSLTR